MMRCELAGLFEEHAKQHARFEGRSSMRDGRGGLAEGRVRQGAQAVLEGAIASHHAHSVANEARPSLCHQRW